MAVLIASAASGGNFNTISIFSPLIVIAKVDDLALAISLNAAMDRF